MYLFVTMDNYLLDTAVKSSSLNKRKCRKHWPKLRLFAGGILWWNCSKEKNLFYKHTKYLVILTLLSFPQTSGLSTWIGRQMLSLSSLPYWAVTLLACILVSLVTEFVSNPATITIFLPILCSMVSENNDIFSLFFPHRLVGMFQDIKVLAFCSHKTQPVPKLLFCSLGLRKNNKLRQPKAYFSTKKFIQYVSDKGKT